MSQDSLNWLAAQSATVRATAYHDKGSMATIARVEAVASLGIAQRTGALAWLMWLAVGVGFRSRPDTLMSWT